MSEMRGRLESKLEHESESYRLNKVLEILLQADLRRLDELCSKAEKSDAARKRE